MSKRGEIPETRSTQQSTASDEKKSVKLVLRAKLEAKGERWEWLVASGMVPAYLLEEIKKVAEVE